MSQFDFEKELDFSGPEEESLEDLEAQASEENGAHEEAREEAGAEAEDEGAEGEAPAEHQGASGDGEEEAEQEAPEADDPLEELRRQTEELRKRLNEVAAFREMAQQQTWPATDDAKKAQEQAAATEPEAKPQEQRPNLVFVTEEEAEEIVENPAKINEVLTRVYNQALEDTYKALPQLVVRMVNTQMTMERLVSDFYRENDDLAPYRDFVALVGQEIESKPENAGRPYPELLQEIAAEARKRLGLMKKAEQASAAQKPRASFADPRGTRRRLAPQLSEIEREIQDLAEI